ncbi:MAG: primosomal protein N' [Bacteroidaceae bacterium]|nr:primosomal protein N' [Bacteroidaceae bacterium]
MDTYADVVMPLPLEGTFTYALPQGLSPQVRVGCRVIVPFGKRKFYSAVVVRLHNDKPDYATREVMELLDEQPVLLPAQLRLWQWISEYYLCTLGEVSKAALPGGMRLESESKVMLSPDYADASSAESSGAEGRGGAVALILDALSHQPEQTISELQHSTGIHHILPPVRQLLAQGTLLMKEEVRRTYKPKTVTCVRISDAFFDEGELNTLLASMQRMPAQSRLLLCYAEMSVLSAALAMRNPQLLKEVTRQQLLEASGCTPSVLSALRSRGVLDVYQKQVGRITSGCALGEILLPQLSEAQQRAFDEIHTQWQTHDVCLLHGVTSSGKTELYIHLIQEALNEGRQVFYLLPEIALTVQLTERLKRVFGDRLGVYHSRYPDAERVELYQKMLSDEPYDIIVGVRSSVFLPFRRLGLVIIDEEHETSFKQTEPAPRYHGRNTALMLAHQCGAHTLLGTATPSLESYRNAMSGKYGLVSLTTRYGDVRLPEIEVVDIAEQQRKKFMRGPFSPRLLSLMRETLERREQVILFQNRRGFSPMVECHTCGWVPRCTRCDVTLTLHRSQHALTCHYCGASYPIPSVCPNCQSHELQSRGYGTERIEDGLERLFPEARIARMDLDTTRSRTGYEQLLDDFQRGRTDILVGTQMVTKGLDFQHVSLVGILNADTMLAMPDFRSHERAFQMMAQVAGRAGRRQMQGRVVLQTYAPTSPIIRQVVSHDYASMYAEQIRERELFNYPPCCRLFYVFMKHRDEGVVARMAAEAAALMRQVFGERVMGPDTPTVSRVQQMHIRNLLLKVELQASMAVVRQRLRQIQAHLLSQPAYRSAQFYYDVD